MPKTLKILCLTLALIILPYSTSCAWWDTGHTLVAQIAYDRLDPEVKTQVDKLIPMFGDSFDFKTFTRKLSTNQFDKYSYPKIYKLSALTKDSFPLSNSFIEASIWLDDVSSGGVPSFWKWHGSARPYDPEKILPQEVIEEKISHLKHNDSVKAIQDAKKGLSNKKTSGWEKAFRLRILIHVVGDAHCPSHCITLYNKTFPKGDRFGTRFEISTTRHLHALWDSMMLLDKKRIPIPITPRRLSKIKKLAGQITEKYPEQKLIEANNLDPETWIKESYQIGILGYQNIEPDGIPSDEYIAKNRELALKRIALAGYRLAKILNSNMSYKKDEL